MKMNTLLVLSLLGILLILSGCTQANTDTAVTTGENTPTLDDSVPHDDAMMEHDDAMTDDAMTHDDTMMDDSNDSMMEHDDSMMEHDDVTNTIAQFASASPENGYKAVYSAVSMINGNDVTSNTTLYVKVPQFRSDSMIESSGFSIETRTFYSLDGTDVVSCSNFQGNWNCQTTTVEAGTTQAGTEATNPDYSFESDGTKTVAGENGTCFAGTSISHPEQSFRLCYTDDGIMLYYFIDTGQGATTEMTATSVTRGIDNSVFELPA